MGGNVFKNLDKTPATIRIAKDDVFTTVKCLEAIVHLPLLDNLLGSSGKKETSGDIDLAISESIPKDTLIDQLVVAGISRNDIKKSGDNVHCKFPINGNASNGYVQIDFMFGDPQWQKVIMSNGASSKFTGEHRHVLLASIATANGLKWSYKHGLVSRTSNNTISKDPEYIAEILLNGTLADLESVETILEKIKSFANYDELISNAKEDLGLN
jgi:hypothetical protein